MTYEVALVSDRAGSFATVLSRPVPRFIEGGRIIVTTLATFDSEVWAATFLEGVRGVEAEERERTQADCAAFERHGLVPSWHRKRASDVAWDAQSGRPWAG